MRTMKTLIVDDERLARHRLQRLLLQEPDFEIVGHCKNVRQARELIANDVPDVMFVDVQMPRADGFALLGGIEPRAMPAVIFVTAFEHYAVQAFEVKACDYLLKPVSPPRLKVAAQRARELLRLREGHEQGDEPPSRPRERETDAQPSAVLVRTGAKVLRIGLDCIDWIEAAGNYVSVSADGKTHLIRETISAFEAKLPPGKFARIHRTAIVNLDRVVEFHPNLNGDFSVTLRDGKQLRMSRTYRGRIRDVFGNAI
jgi:two-component system, LytTR family, response regulator